MVAQTETIVANDPGAHELLRAAHERGYRFPAGFGGFSADVNLSTDSSTTQGTVSVRAPRDLTLDLDVPEEDAGWVRQEIASIAGHRWPTPYEQSDGRWTLTLSDDSANPLGQSIKVHDDPFDSGYRVRDGKISQVLRKMGPMRFTITMLDHQQAVDGRLLPSLFTVTFWDTENDRLTRSDAYTDSYVVVDGVTVPSYRRVVTFKDSGQSVRELTLSNHVLLEAVATSSAGEAERRHHS
ncbi:hypothetical protein BH09CHL1_BH09CHL1_21480 [soil metagenome]